MTDEEFVYMLSEYRDAPEVVQATLESEFGDLDNVPDHIVEALDAAGFEVGYAEDDYEPDGSENGLQELEQQVAAIEDYLASVPPEQYMPTAEVEITPEQYERELVEHIDGQLEALEEQAGRELSALEIQRITVEALQSITPDEPYPDVQWSAEVAAENHEARTDTRAGRQAEMTANLQAQNYEEPSQERVDELAEQDDNRSRTELMMHALDGKVSLNGGSETEAEWPAEP
jgi:hypothetical protein